MSKHDLLQEAMVQCTDCGGKRYIIKWDGLISEHLDCPRCGGSGRELDHVLYARLKRAYADGCNDTLEEINRKLTTAIVDEDVRIEDYKLTQPESTVRFHRGKREAFQQAKQILALAQEVTE